MSVKKTKGQLEAEISSRITQFEKEYMGRGPEETRTFIIQDMVLIRLKGALTPAEVNLAKTPEGAQLIKQMRLRLVETSRHLVQNIVEEITSARMISLHTDISSHTGERVFVLVLDINLEKELLKSQNQVSETLKRPHR